MRWKKGGAIVGVATEKRQAHELVEIDDRKRVDLWRYRDGRVDDGELIPWTWDEPVPEPPKVVKPAATCNPKQEVLDAIIDLASSGGFATYYGVDIIAEKTSLTEAEVSPLLRELSDEGKIHCTGSLETPDCAALSGYMIERAFL